MTASQKSESVQVKVDVGALSDQLDGVTHVESIGLAVDAAWAEAREKLIEKIIEDFDEAAAKRAKKDARDAHERAAEDLERQAQGVDEPEARAWNEDRDPAFATSSQRDRTAARDESAVDPKPAA